MSFESYIKAVHEIDARLTYQSVEGSGRLLDGVFYDREGRISPLGVAQLPYVQPFEWSDEEAPSVAGGSVDQKLDLQGDSPYQHTMNLQFLVATRRVWGWFARDISSLESDPKLAEGGLGIMQIVARVKDAMERRRTGGAIVDGSLNGILHRAMEIAVRENFVTDTSTVVVVDVRLVMEAECRGFRTGLLGAVSSKSYTNNSYQKRSLADSWTDAFFDIALPFYGDFDLEAKFTKAKDRKLGVHDGAFPTRDSTYSDNLDYVIYGKADGSLLAYYQGALVFSGTYTSGDTVGIKRSSKVFSVTKNGLELFAFAAENDATMRGTGHVFSLDGVILDMEDSGVALDLENLSVGVAYTTLGQLDTTDGPILDAEGNQVFF